MSKKYLFVGNRFYVLEKMIELKLNIVKIFAVENSHLEKELISRKIEYELLPEKSEFIKILSELSFDFLVSNGCPYILPISKLDNGKSFINIHPSLLPDLKGKTPINGALLFNRRHGVTCHYMNDEIDGGDVLSQIEIPLTADVNLDLLYQVSFRMEGLVFEKAYKNGFKVIASINAVEDPIYYSKKLEDRILYFEDGFDIICSKVKAFCSEGQFAILYNNSISYEVIDLTIIENDAVVKLFENHKIENIIYMVYGNQYVLVRLWGRLVQVKIKNTKGLEVGSQFLQSK